MSCNKLFKEALGLMNSNTDILKSWITDSRHIVNDYISKGSNAHMDKFFRDVTPEYRNTTYRVGMLDSKTAANLKEGDYTENIFPFATSKNSEENEIFDRITTNRLKKHKDKVKVIYRIHNSSVPQYDISGINPAETEVLIKPNTIFRVDRISEYGDKKIIDLVAPAKQKLVRSKRKLTTLLSAGALIGTQQESLTK